jgi:hypothetical protein
MEDSLEEILNFASNKLTSKNAFDIDSKFISMIPDILKHGTEEEWIRTSEALQAG